MLKENHTKNTKPKIMKGKTLIEYFYNHETKNPDKPFLKQPFGDQWETYTWGEVGQMARKLATYLNQQNLKPNSNIGLVSKNCREWIIADLAIMMAGHVSVPFFATLTGDQIAEVLEIGDVEFLFVGKVEVWNDMKKGVPADMPIVRFPHYEGNSKIERGKDWNEIMNTIEPMQGNPAPKLDDLFTIIFTSGTTGTPKGVMHTYRAITDLVDLTEGPNPLKVSATGDNRFFSYLPLNHIAERAVVEVMSLRYGGTIAFTESISRFAANLKEIKPTLFFAVPRIWTKFMLAILDKMPQSRLDLLLKIPIVSSMIKKKIVSGLGLQESRCSVVGAAPIPQATKEWFGKIGIPISEAYGMTENCAVCTFLDASINKPGSAGVAQAGSELKIDPDNNEILMKAPYVMQGYYKDPEKTAETLEGGWLHTGDQGKLENGYLYITGRVKDTFKSAKAEFIVPSEIEAKFTDNTDIEQMCLLGLGLPQPILTVVPSEMGLAKSKAELKESLEKTAKEANAQLANYQRVGAVVVVKEPFSIENGVLTPTLKVKRSKIHEMYKDRMLAYCEDPEMVLWE